MKKLLSIILLIMTTSFLSFSQDLTVNFQFDKSKLDDETSYLLAELVNQKKPIEIILKGFADTIGTNNYNRTLVEKRIEAVEELILSIKDSIKIQKINYGEENSYSCNGKFRKVDVFLQQSKYQSRKPKYKDPQVYSINNKKDTILKCVEGTKLKIPKNIFMLKASKELPKGLIQFHVTEYYSIHEMVAANLTTQADNRILETGGMLLLKAYSNNNQCEITNGSNIGISFKEITEEDSMKLFSGSIIDENINWKLINSNPTTSLTEESEDENEVFEVGYKESKSVFLMVEDMPTFLNGDINVFKNYVSRNLEYPAIAKEERIQGKVIVKFIVDKYGLIKNPKIIRSVHPSFDYEVLHAISATPRWKPGIQEGLPVDVSMTTSFNFELNNEMPVNDSNRIKSQSDFSFENQPVTEKKLKTNKFISEFYLFTNKLNWLNCDRFYQLSNRADIKILVESEFESYYAIFNNKRSIIGANTYDSKSKIKRFMNIPSNQKYLIVGIKIVNEKTFFTNFKATPNGQSYTPKFQQIDKNELIDEMKEIGL